MELNKILELHEKWHNNEPDGKRADLRRVNLEGATLSNADLREADLIGANLRSADLRGADLREADLRGADLRGTDLRGANLRSANLRSANLRGANLEGANLIGANLDFSVLPLWCGGLDFKIDERIAKQLVYHTINLMQTSGIDTSKIFKQYIYKWMEDSHLVTEHRLPKLEKEKRK